MNYLTNEQILFLHSRLIEETGGSHGVRDMGLLESAVARPQATFGGEELYPEFDLKAAALMESLIRNHPFLDGNKRTGIAAATLFLRLNGKILQASQKDLEIFTLQVARGQKELTEIVEWFKNHSVSEKDSQS